MLKWKTSSQLDQLYSRYSLFVSSVLGQNHYVDFDVLIVVSVDLEEAALVEMVPD